MSDKLGEFHESWSKSAKMGGTPSKGDITVELCKRFPLKRNVRLTKVEELYPMIGFTSAEVSKYNVEHLVKPYMLAIQFNDIVMCMFNDGDLTIISTHDKTLKYEHIMHHDRTVQITNLEYLNKINDVAVHADSDQKKADMLHMIFSMLKDEKLIKEVK